MKRFWKDVVVTPDNGITLDGRPVRTPGRAALTLPTPALADAVADEWRAVGDTIDPSTMPLTGIANTAIDRVTPDPAAFSEGLARYGESDLLYYRAGDPAELAARQTAAWDPLLEWARRRFDVQFEPTTGVVHQAQPSATVARLAEAVATLDSFRLAALSTPVTITGSLIGALALTEGEIDADTLWAAAHVDEDWQAERWGADTLAAEARDAEHRAFDAAARFISSLRA